MDNFKWALGFFVIGSCALMFADLKARSRKAFAVCMMIFAVAAICVVANLYQITSDGRHPTNSPAQHD